MDANIYSTEHLVSVYNSKTKEREMRNIIVSVDMRSLAWLLADKAVRSKSKRARAVYGAVCVAAK